MELRKKVIAGNWKMNNTRIESKNLIEKLKPLVEGKNDCEIVICVPFTDLELVINWTNGTNLKIGAQNCHYAESGAYTGEISAKMLKELGVLHVILGHSERRQLFGETDETVNLRVKAALDFGICPIVCVGESLKQRENDLTSEIVAMQVKCALKGISNENAKNVIIAYEPIWAIGTGKTASSKQAQQVCEWIRRVVANMFGSLTAQSLRILYGGSMNESNSRELLQENDIDGGLIGGASLVAEKFAEIVYDACSLEV